MNVAMKVHGPRTLSSRLIVTVVALVAVTSLLVASVVTLIMRHYLTDRLDEKLTQSLERAQRAPLRPFGEPPNRPDLPLPNPGRGQEVGLITYIPTVSGSIVSTNGEAPSVNSAATRELDLIPPDGVARTVDLPEYGSYRVLAGPSASADRLVVGLPTESVDDTLASLLWWELLLGIGATASAAAAARTIIRRQLAPLRSVAATAHQVTSAPLATATVSTNVRVPDSLTDPRTEVGQVGEALNRLLDHVESALKARYDSEQQARQFLADASHELRTPLSTIKGYAELSRRTQPQDPAPILAKVETEAARMTTLVEDMMLLARLDAGREIDHRPVDLTRLLMEAVNDARVVDTERTWELDVPSAPVTVIGDEQRLHQAVTNVLRNASRHTTPGTHVTITLATDDAVTITIHDDGPGLTPDLVPRVFERFTRGDRSRSRQLGGAGLGMSLVKAIMTAHGGDANVVSVPGDTTFTLTLPSP